EEGFLALQVSGSEAGVKAKRAIDLVIEVAKPAHHWKKASAGISQELRPIKQHRHVFTCKHITPPHCSCSRRFVSVWYQ
ncbi:MAG TPA: hypothetical protein VFN35_06325, partial [Ktedonobacteraceae bacterium]|nr:hypothetical protein [Ktedonobacteraceae bacterium]